MFRIAVILAASSLVLPAQVRPRPERPRAEARREIRRERWMAQLHQFRAKRIQASLGVSEERAKAIADRWEQHDLESMGRRQEMKGLRDQINGILVGPGSEADKNRRLQPMVERLAVLRGQEQESKQKFMEDIRNSLTPAEQARFILLAEDLQRSVKEAIVEQQKDKLP
jgi:hypothetical protein